MCQGMKELERCGGMWVGRAECVREGAQVVRGKGAELGAVSLVLVPGATDISNELLLERQAKQALLEAVECEEEYRCSQVLIEMRTGPTGELLLYGDMLKEAEAEVARNEALIVYFEDREAERLREKGIRKERNAFFQPAPARKALASADPMVHTTEFLDYLEWLLTQERTPIFDGQHKQLQAPKKIDTETITKEIESVRKVTLKP